MADPSEKELKAPDGMAAAIEPINEERHDAPDGAFAKEVNEKDSGDEIENDLDDDEKSSNGDAKARGLEATRSYATDASAATQPVAPTPEKKSFGDKINPLKWGSPPPIPEEREVSHEYQASFFSKLTFQWVAPLMQVSPRAAGEWSRTAAINTMDGES